MEKRDDLLKKQADITQRICALTNNPIAARMLISDLISVTEQTCVKPVVFEIADAQVVERYEGGNYEVGVTDRYAYFKTSGGYVVACEGNNTALYYTIIHIISELKARDEKPANEREDIELHLSALTYVLECPLFAFSNEDMTFNVATTIVTGIQNIIERAEEMELAKDDAEEQHQFEEEELAMERLTKIAEQMREMTEAEEKKEEVKDE